MPKTDPMSWVDEQEAKNAEKSSGDYFNIQEGDNRVQLLSHVAPLAQVWDNTEKKYRVAEEGDKNISVKGVCWVLQDGVIKSAKLPYTVVKAIRELQNDPDYAFESFPMPRLVNIKAKNAGTKEVEYTVIPSPKENAVPKDILDELGKKPSPEEIVEKIKGKVSQRKSEPVEYPNEINPDDIPF
jgi:hypothetical protein